MSIEDEDLIGTRDVTRMSNRSEAAVRGWVREGKLRAIRLPSGQCVFRRADVVAFLAQRQGASAAA